MTPLARDLSDLPRDNGLVPDKHMRFADVLVQRWAAEQEAAGEKPNAIDGTRFRGSDAGKCARLLGYKAAGIPASDPMDLTGTWNTSLGTLLHDAWQEALQERYPDAEIEVKAPIVDDDGSMHIDAVIAWEFVGHVPAEVRGPGWGEDGDGYTISYELKSIGGFGFKNAVGRARKGQAAEGPRTDHLLQGSLGGVAVDADEVLVGYLAKEALSKSFKVADERDRFLAEWTFTREQYEPLARAEAERVAGILEVVDGGMLPRRIVPHDMPPGAEIVDPSKGTWEVVSDGFVSDSGSYWGCAYCSHQTLCAQTEPGRIPIESVVTIGEAA